MTQAEVQALTDEQLCSEWSVIKAMFRMGAQRNLPTHQGNIFFANWVNVSNEMSKRGLDKQLEK